jgi:hypothetical protein
MSRPAHDVDALLSHVEGVSHGTLLAYEERLYGTPPAPPTRLAWRGEPTRGMTPGCPGPDTAVQTDKETSMHRTAWKTMALAFVGLLACVPHGMAQQDPSPRPHAPGIRMAADPHDDHDAHAHGWRGHGGPMGHEGLRLQQHFERLTQQLKLTD